MKPLATRTDALQQSDIRAVTLMVNEVGGINLGQGICDLPTPAPIRDAAKAAIDGDKSIYTAYNGVRPLREGILHKAQSYNRIPATSDGEVMVAAGSTGAFVSAIQTLCDPGDEVILFEPFYGYHTGVMNLLGVKPVAVPLQAPSWGVDFDALEAAITPRTKAVIVCTPANPCGKVWTRDELEKLLGLLEKHDLWAITDEIYEYMTYDGHKHVSLASLPGAYPRTITISGFSKTYNMTGWRLGYAVAPEPVIGKMGLVNDLLYICAPAPLQYGVEAAFHMDDVYFEQMRADYTAKRTLLCETLEACGFGVNWPDGSYYVLANFEAFADARPGFADDRQACQTLVREAGVAAVPGNSFFADPEHGRYFLRFCYAKDVPLLEDACRRLRAAYG